VAIFSLSLQELGYFDEIKKTARRMEFAEGKVKKIIQKIAVPKISK
jgi:hypothetical protein